MAIGVDALIAPKPFKAKDKDPETLLIDFDKMALLLAVGGLDMEIGDRKGRRRQQM